MKLSDLVGERYLSGVEFGMLHRDGFWGPEDCNFVKFAIDSINYLAVEDPDDGYRSRCEELIVTDESPQVSFPPVKVICSMKEADGQGYGSPDVLVMTDVITHKVILEVGTEDFDDWYPYCHFEYHPENMACNQNVEEHT